MENQQAMPGVVARRGFLKGAVGGMAAGAALMSMARPAQAQSASDIDALNLMLNVEYLIAQCASAATGDAVPADRLTGNGVAGVPVVPGRAVTFSDPILRLIVREMSADNRSHLIPMRVVVGALSVRQPLIDISAGATAPFSVAMQRAGVVAAGATFDPYASEENLLYTLFFLKNISVAAYRGLSAAAVNRVVTQNFTGLLGTECIHAATIRSYLYSRGATTPRLRDNSEKIAAFQRSLNGGQVFQGVAASSRSYPGGSVSVPVANIAPTQGNGSVGGLSTGQILNQLYLTSASATSGGFFPQGVNGAINTSASA